jgi:opacity protein-like surface antigen
MQHDSLKGSEIRQKTWTCPTKEESIAPLSVAWGKLMTRSYLLGGVVAIGATALMGLAPALAADIVTEPEPVVVEENNWYFSIHGGWKFGEDWDDDIDDGDFDVDIEADDGWRVGAAIGYSFSSILSIEGELSYLNQDFDHADCDGCIFDDYDLDGDVSIWTGMVNLIAGFPLGTFFRPYVGGGLGFAHVSLNDLDDIDSFDLDDSDTAFAAQAFAGIDFMLTDNMALGGRYRVLHINDLDFSDDFDFDHEINPDLIQSIEAVLTVGF